VGWLLRLLQLLLPFLRTARYSRIEESKRRKRLARSLSERLRGLESRAVARGEYDDIFRTEGHGIPVPFLCALARRESNNNPSEATGPAWGLLQVGIDSRAGNVLKEYNSRNGTDYQPSDVLDPRINVRVATDLLARIVRLYRAKGLVEDWQNANWAGLVVAGWNSGYSTKAGVLRVVDYLRERAIPVTLDSVYSNAKAAGATKHLQSPKKREWQRSVVQAYFRELGKPLSKDGDAWLPLAILALLLLR